MKDPMKSISFFPKSVPRWGGWDEGVCGVEWVMKYTGRGGSWWGGGVMKYIGWGESC